MEYRPSPPPRLVDSIFSPIFLRSVPERKPRTEWACQPVAFISSAKVAPLDFSVVGHFDFLFFRPPGAISPISTACLKVETPNLLMARHFGVAFRQTASRRH